MTGDTCPDCGGPMRPLFTGMYCGNDCDRPPDPKLLDEVSDQEGRDPLWGHLALQAIRTKIWSGHLEWFRDAAELKLRHNGYPIYIWWTYKQNNNTGSHIVHMSNSPPGFNAMNQSDVIIAVIDKLRLVVQKNRHGLASTGLIDVKEMT